MTKTTTRARYTLEFKQEAVRLVEGGQSIAAAARTLGVVDQTLFNWVKAHRQGKLKGADSKVVSAEQMEISRLRAELARVKMERDILGKATAYFAKLRREVAYIIVSPAHEVGDETGCSVSRSLPVHASLATASCEATGTTRRANGPRHLPRGSGVTCQHQGG
jgi:transposase-like protein